MSKSHTVKALNQFDNHHMQIHDPEKTVNKFMANITDFGKVEISWNIFGKTFFRYVVG